VVLGVEACAFGVDDFEEIDEAAFEAHARECGAPGAGLGGRMQVRAFAARVLVAHERVLGFLECTQHGLLVAREVFLGAGFGRGDARPEVDFNAVFTRGRVPSPKVRAFVDFLVERLRFDVTYMQKSCPNVYRAQVEELLERPAVEPLPAPPAKVRKVAELA